VDDTIHNKRGNMKKWIKENVNRLQDGIIGLCAGFYFGIADVGIIISVMIVGLGLGIIAWILGAK